MSTATSVANPLALPMGGATETAPPARTITTLQRAARTATLVAVAMATVGFVALVLAFISDLRQALASYLFAFCVAFTTVIGALMLVMIAELTGASWFAGLRPLTLRIAGVVPALALLALPVVFNVRALYSWATPALLAPDVRAIVARKGAWLSAPFFAVRTLSYLAVWIVVAELLRRARPRHQTLVSALSMIAVAFTFTFAAFDWVMSLDPGWFSTMFGVYLFAGGILSTLALVTVCRDIVARCSGEANGAQLALHTVPLAKLLFTFSMFWAYIAYSQYFIVWIADLPTEVSWYVLRSGGAWRSVAIVLAIGQFGAPFILLLGYSLKRNSAVVFSVAVWLLVMHTLECYWLVMPAFHEGRMRLHYADVAALLFVGGLLCAVALRRESAIRRDVELRHEKGAQSVDADSNATFATPAS